MRLKRKKIRALSPARFDDEREASLREILTRPQRDDAFRFAEETLEARAIPDSAQATELSMFQSLGIGKREKRNAF